LSVLDTSKELTKFKGTLQIPSITPDPKINDSDP